MRVALVVPGGVDASGTERVIPALVWLVERLARRHDVHVFAMHQEPEPGDWLLRGAQVHNIGTTGARRRRFLARFAREHRAAPFQVVHAIFASPRAALVARYYGIPLVVHLAGGELVALPEIGYGEGRTLVSRLRRTVATAGAARITVATAYMRALAATAGLDAAVVPLGVATDLWPPRAPRPRDPTRPARLLHIGDLRAVKDQPLLLDAVHLVRQRGGNVELHIAGVDTLNGALQRSPAARALAGCAHWHGLLGREALRELVDQADLHLMTSRHEAGPLAVLEAAVAGVPTVGTAVGHVADWAPSAAIAVPVGDASALAGAIAALLADEPRRLRLAHAAQSLALRDDADTTAAAFESTYLAVAAGRAPGPRPLFS